MKKTVLIIEDDISQMNMLEKLVLSVDGNAVIFTADNVTSAYKILMEKTIDIFMVDIILDTSRPGDASGIRLVEKLRAIPKYMFTPVIFVTSLEDPSLYCYKDLNCIGYIEKPFDPQSIIKILNKAFNYTTAREKDTILTFRKDGILYPVEVSKIVYLETWKHTNSIHLSDGSILEIPYKTCKQILEEADADNLVQCSRSTIINKDFVLSVDIVNKYIVFKNDLGRVDIGVTFRKKIMAEFGYGC